MKEQFPQAFAERVAADPFLGSFLLEALDTDPPTAIRMNPAKTSADFAEAQSIPWSANGHLLRERPVFTLDPLFHAGCYYPQEAGSQMLDAVLRQLALPEDPVVLDLCAAPGGKSTLIAAFLGKKGLLVANEVIQPRSRILRENMLKWGSPNVLVTNNDPADFGQLGAVFDCIVIDAPCSGEGMFRKDPAARSEWSPANVHLCSARQKRIVMDVWESLHPGGYAVYSTCTFNAEENEQNVRWMAEETGAEIVGFTLPAGKSGRGGTGWYALPGITETEGFYIAVLRKPETAPAARFKYVKKTKLSVAKDTISVKDFVSDAAVSVLQWQDFRFAVPEEKAG